MPKNQVPMWERIVDVKTRGQIREEEMTDAEKKERERLVKGMKKSADDFETRYPGRGEDVMYATATKMAMEESPMTQKKPTGFYVMGKTQSVGWYKDQAEAEKVAKQMNYRGGTIYTVVPDMGKKPGMTEAMAFKTFTVMAIDDPTPTYKRNDYNYKPSAKVLDQMRVSQDEIMLVAKDLRRKFPNATISVENKGGKIVKVFKPGEMIKETRLSVTENTIGLSKAWLLKAYAENEKNKNHVGNALFLTRLFGTPQEILFVDNLADIREKEGFIDPRKYKKSILRLDALHDRYYAALKALDESHEDSDIKNVSLQEAEDNTDYETYFRDMLKKHGYDSPADIPDDKKADFFNAVDKGYSAKNESRRLTEVEQQPLDFEYLATFGFTKKNLVRQYRENEANNLHSDNALFLAMLFGTPQEQQLAAKLKNIARAEGGLDYAKYQPLIQKVNSLHSKYYSKLMALPESRPVAKKMREGVEENDDLGMMKGQLMSIIDRASALLDRVSANPPSDVEAWVQAKTTDADTAITALHDYFMYSDDQNPEFPVEPLAEAELLVKGEKPISGVTLPLKKTAALAFASAFMDRPTGATPEAIVNQALAVYFQKNKVPNIVRLRNLGRMLQLVSKMGINWNEELIPPQLVRFVNAAASPTGLPMDEAVEGPPSPSSMSATQRLSQQQKKEKEQLAARHQQQKMAAQQRDFQEKQRKSQSPAAR